MKNKKAIYILLPLVLIIWGTIFWKIFSEAGNSTVHLPLKPIVKTENKIAGEKERPVLCYNYQDPFLKSNPKPVTTVENEKKKEIKTVNRIVRWPVIQYKGLIKSKRKKTPVGMLMVGDKEYLVRENDTQKDIQIVSITTDSIGLEYQQDKRFFKRYGLN